MQESAQEILQNYSAYLVNHSDFTMEKRIGQGGFGDVYRAIHKPTGTKCAVKQLFVEEFKDSELTSFVREVVILAMCHDLFLLPFLGFTFSPPFLIVTEFIAKGSLYDALQHKPGAPQLSPSHKTLIAIGIARGMMVLHRQKIIHRDLKSLNILLDDRYLPKICDFGISRFIGDKEVELTREVGTPHWMAPEMFESNHYSEKIDVYAYAMLLYEMLTESVPFKGKSAIQVVTSVTQNNERPVIPSSCPPELKELIQICWTRDPDQRPSFSQIFQVFMENKVMFKNTEPKSIQAINLLINEYDKRNSDPLSHLLSKYPQSKAPPQQVPPKNSIIPPQSVNQNQNIYHQQSFNQGYPPQSSFQRNQQDMNYPPQSSFQRNQQDMNYPPQSSFQRNQPQNPFVQNQNQFIQPEINSPQNISNFSKNRNSSSSNLFLESPSIMFSNKKISKEEQRKMDLSNPLSPNFPNALHEEFNNLNLQNSIEIFNILRPTLTDNNLQIVSFVIISFSKLFERNFDFIEPFINCGLHNHLPFQIKELIPPLIIILSAVIEKKADIFSFEMFQSLLLYKTFFYSEILHLFSKFISKSSLNTSSKNIIQIFLLIEFPIEFMLDYLKIIYFLYLNVSWFKIEQIQFLIKLFNNLFLTNNFEIINKVYSFIFLTNDLIPLIPIDYIINNLTQPTLTLNSLIFLTKLTNLPSSKKLIFTLSSLCKNFELSTYLLIRIAENSIGASVILENNEWIQGQLFSTYQLFLILFSYKNLRPIISEINWLPNFFNQLIQLNNLEIFSTFTTIIRRLTLSSNLIEKLISSGFLKNFIEKSIISQEQDKISNLILMIDALARITYVEDYLLIIPNLPLMFSLNSVQTLTLALVLFSYSNLQILFKKPEIIESIQNINVPSNYEEYKIGFIEELNKTKKKKKKLY